MLNIWCTFLSLQLSAIATPDIAAPSVCFGAASSASLTSSKLLRDCPLRRGFGAACFVQLRVNIDGSTQRPEKNVQVMWRTLIGATIQLTPSPTPAPPTPPTLPPACVNSKAPVDVCTNMFTEKKYSVEVCQFLRPLDQGNNPAGWKLGFDVSPYTNFSKCTASILTRFLTCNQYCSKAGMYCIQGSDNDQYNQNGFGTGCSLAPANAIRPRPLNYSQNGCNLSLQTQVCQCGIPPQCDPTPAPTPAPLPCDSRTDPCAAMTNYDSVCPSVLPGWYSDDDDWTTPYPIECPVAVVVRNDFANTTCADYCADQGLTCIHGMPNDFMDLLNLSTPSVPPSCVVSASWCNQQTTAQGGCLQYWPVQVCQCGYTQCPTPSPTLSPSPSPTLPTLGEPTPSPTSPTPCVGSCTIVDDPHITVFDKAQVSLMTFARAPSQEDNGFGDMWLVKSRLVSIQARYEPDTALQHKNLYVKAVGVGGPFLGNKTLVVGTLDDAVTWDGEDILQHRTSGVVVGSLVAKFEVFGLIKAIQGIRGVVVAELPMGVTLTVKRKRRNVDVIIKMPQMEGGQEGLCGNFNGLAGDDSLELAQSRADPRVSPQESFFIGVTHTF